jgi:basic membrane lipoprotein Med (substrate-binding protein (PBP1-ABC) superfamily)
LAETPQDGGWNAAHWRGIEELKAFGEVVSGDYPVFSVSIPELGRVLEVHVVEKVGYADADIERAARRAINKGADMIFGTWWDSQYALARLADEFPDVLFEHCSSYPLQKSTDHPNRNFSTYFIRIEQADFIAGQVAALAGFDRAGIVGTYWIPEPMRGVNAFTLGLRSVNPAATAHVVWIDSWLDVAKETEAAVGLVAEGYPLIRQMADTPYSSREACRGGAAAVGYGTDPSGAPCSLVTNQWEWGPYYTERVLAAMGGTWQPHDWWGGLADGAVRMTGWRVSPDIRNRVQSSGGNPFRGPFKIWGHDGWEAEVPAGRCLTDRTQLQMAFYVEGVDRQSQLPPLPEGGYVLETEACP